MFSETRYALNGDLGVAYRASREGARDIVVVPNWFTNCEVIPEHPSIQGWAEAMTSLGRLIFFDQPGSGASDPVTPDALPIWFALAMNKTFAPDDPDLAAMESLLVNAERAEPEPHARFLYALGKAWDDLGEVIYWKGASPCQ